jgi:RNA polymerase sigma factor (sigma-70 family)
MSKTVTVITDAEIVSALKNGNRETGATFFVRKYQKFVYSTAFRYLNSEPDSEDVSQEVFIKAIESIDKFRGDSSLKTWLYRITKNNCLNILRKKKVLSFLGMYKDQEFEFDIKDPSNTPDESLEKVEFENRFLKVLAKLPEKQRETFALRYFEEMSYDEISKLIGTSTGGLKANYFQAIKKLANELKEFKG